jgi:hypothetical protein
MLVIMAHLDKLHCPWRKITSVDIEIVTLFNQWIKEITHSTSCLQ